MSLQVWLPLNGDLHNQGLAYNVSVQTTNIPTVDNNGKIGSCYSFNGTSQYLQFQNLNIDNYSELSICFWVYSESETQRNCLFVCRSGSTMQINFFNTGLNFRDSKHSSQVQLTFAEGQQLVDLNCWTHCCLVYNNGDWYVYKNGQKIYEQKYTALATLASGIDEIRLGRTTISSGTSYFQGKMNDVRIYNHALSPQEIEKISQGLVLHYQLNDTRIEETTNLLSLTQSHKTESVESINTATGTSATYSGEYITMTNTATGYFTFSAYINNITETPIRLRLGLKTGSSTTYTEGNTIASGKKGWSVVTVEKLPTHNDSITIGYFVNKQVQKLITNPLIYHAQLENHAFQTLWTPGGTTRPAIETVYDCSGFGNNGTITGNLSAAAGSPRYKFATQLHDQDTSYICTNNTFAFLHSNPFSISVWININQESLNNNSQHRHIFSGQIGLYISYSSQNAVIFQYKEGSTSKYVSIPDSKILEGWHLFTIVYDENQNLVIYVDGTEKVNSQYNINLNSSNLLYIGSRANTSWADKYSDFRIYATALSNDQVNTLFRTSMIVNSDGTTSPRGLS